MPGSAFPALGFGLGLRAPHFEAIFEGPTRAEWFEALTENYLGVPGYGLGPQRHRLRRVRERWPVVLHGVSLSIGSSDPLDTDYLKQVRALIDEIEPAWVSDHLCWTGVQGKNSHDLLPLAYDSATIEHLVRRIDAVQTAWGRRLVLENVSSYVEFTASEMTEWEFVAEVIRRSGAGLLLDVNNIYVSSRNHGFDPRTYLEAMPWAAVAQIHLAGHRDHGDRVIDTHDQPLCPEVLALYTQAAAAVPRAATMIEWDAKIPPLVALEAELDRVKETHARATLRAAEPLLSRAE